MDSGVDVDVGVDVGVDSAPPTCVPVEAPAREACDFRSGDPEICPDRCTGGRTVQLGVFVLVVGQVALASPGMDLDGIGGGGAASCGHEDFPGLLDNTDVDNQLGAYRDDLAALAGVEEAGDLTLPAYRGGTHVTAVELRHVDDFIDDDCVDMTVYDATPRPGSPTRTVTDRRGNSFDVAEHLDVLPGSGRYFRATARDGQVSAEGGTFPVAIVGSTGTFAVELDSAEVNLAIALDGGAAGGVAGGAISVDALTDATTCAGIEPMPARELFERIADLDHDGATCTGVSTGLRFSLGEVTLF